MLGSGIADRSRARRRARRINQQALPEFLEGEFRLLLGDSLVHQPTGGLAFGPRGTPHTFQNIGPAMGRLLVITGPSGLEEFFLDYDRRATGHYGATAVKAAALVAGIDFIGPPLAVSAPGTPGR